MPMFAGTELPTLVVDDCNGSMSEGWFIVRIDGDRPTVTDDEMPLHKAWERSNRWYDHDHDKYCTRPLRAGDRVTLATRQVITTRSHSQGDHIPFATATVANIIGARANGKTWWNVTVTEAETISKNKEARMPNDRYGAEADSIETKGEMIGATISIMFIILIVFNLLHSCATEPDKCDPANPDYSWWVAEGVCAP
jgi:hypothetical protein